MPLSYRIERFYEKHGPALCGGLRRSPSLCSVR
jgi:hypothetical protein